VVHAVIERKQTITPPYPNSPSSGHPLDVSVKKLDSTKGGKSHFGEAEPDATSNKVKQDVLLR
jgi:hypothetical protein